MNKKMLAVALLAVLVGIAYFYFMSNEVVAPTQTDEIISDNQVDSSDQPDRTPSPDTNNQPTPDSADYVGLTTAEAEARAERNNDLFRVVEIDGQPQMVTEDFRPGRINATVVNDVVVSYTVEGTTSEPDTPSEPEPAGNDAIIGMTVAQAEAYTKANNIMFRIGAIDGEFLPVTMDYRPGRITAEVNNGIITDFSVE